MSLLKKIWPNPLHCFLIPVFFIVHNFIDFYGLIQLKHISTALVLWLLLPLFVYACAYFFFRTKSNAGFFSCIVLVLYFFSVPLFHLLKKNTIIGEWIKLYAFLIFIFLLLLILLLALKKERLHIYPKTHTFLLLLFCFLLLYDAGAFFISGVQNIKQKNVLFKKDSSLPQLTTNKPSHFKPDIYYFLFDMHGSSAAIQKSFGYDNTLLDTTLIKLKFAVSNNATSASNYTPTSMASVFNMTPLSFTNNKISTFREMYQARNSIRLNPLIPFLQNSGYKIINASSFPIYETDTSYLHHIGWGHPEELLINQTLIPFILKTYDWILRKYFPNSFTSFEQKIYTDDVVTTAAALLKTTAAIEMNDTATAKFVYTHLYIPHTPFKYDSLGNIIPWINKSLQKIESDSMYISQLKYCRNLIIDFAQKIQLKNARRAVIIFQGDHGARDEAMPLSRTFEVLNAIYLPTKSYNELSSDFYTPNTFRYLLNTYFQKQLPMHQPKHVFITLK